MPIPTIKRGRPRGSRRRRGHEDQLPKWALKYLTETALKTGFTRDRVLDDLLKAGAVALKDRYRSIVTYRESIEELWNRPIEPAGKIIHDPEEAQNGEVVNEPQSAERTDWSPDLDFIGDSEPAPENSRIGHAGFDPLEIGRGQLAEGAETLAEPEPPASEPDRG